MNKARSSLSLRFNIKSTNKSYQNVLKGFSLYYFGIKIMNMKLTSACVHFPKRVGLPERVSMTVSSCLSVLDEYGSKYSFQLVKIHQLNYYRAPINLDELCGA